MTMKAASLEKRIRLLLGVFMVGLVASGLTALVLPWGADLLRAWFGSGTAAGDAWPALARWIDLVHRGVHETDAAYPFLLYGTDWLAFGHIAIAVGFLGPLRDPVRNVWVIQFGIVACLLLIPWALLFGPIRGIPLYWRLIDCSFGVFGLVPLLLALRYTCRLAGMKEAPSA